MHAINLGYIPSLEFDRHKTPCMVISVLAANTSRLNMPIGYWAYLKVLCRQALASDTHWALYTKAELIWVPPVVDAECPGLTTSMVFEVVTHWLIQAYMYVSSYEVLKHCQNINFNNWILWYKYKYKYFSFGLIQIQIQIQISICICICRQIQISIWPQAWCQIGAMPFLGTMRIHYWIEHEQQLSVK